MKKAKKILAFILSVLAVFSAVTVTAFAADYSFSYYFTDESQTAVYVSGFEGNVPSDGYVEIPAELDGYPVTGIAAGAFENLISLKGIYISESLTYIDNNAFKGCGDIDIKISQKQDTDDEFDSDDWYDDHKQDYIISGSTLVSYKGSDEIITIPYNCSSIANGAFKNNKTVKTVYIEKELEKIGDSAFEGCTSLESVVAGNGVYGLYIGKNAFKDTPWLNNYPSDLVTLGTTLVKYKGTAPYVAIPNVFTAVAEEAFFAGSSNDIAYKVKVPVTVEIFGDDCFYLYDSISKVYPEIVVFEGSPADKYCKEEGLDATYSALPGDADRNGKTTSADARYVLRISAKMDNPIIDNDVMEVSDITGDSKITAEDARLILRVTAKLDKYSVEELLAMPRTDYELLFSSTRAVALAKAYRCSYSKFAYQEITASDMNYNTTMYLDIYKNELNPANKAQTITYKQDTEEAYNNIYEISLLDATKLKEYSCVVEDDVYNIRLVLNDESFNGSQVDAASFTKQMFPVEGVAHFTNKVKGKYWYNDSLDYDMTYNNCTLEIKIEIATHKIVSMSYIMNYDFEITGKLGGIKIKGENGPATATRTDVIRYNNFIYAAD